MSTIKGLGSVGVGQSSAATKATATQKAGPAAPAHEDLAVFDRASDALSAGAITADAAVRQILETAVNQQMPEVSEQMRERITERLEAMVQANPEIIDQLDQLLAH